MAGFLRKLFGTRPSAPEPAPLHSDRLLVFAGHFGDEAAATDYALGLGAASLASDLGAAIGPDDVEIIYGASRISAARPMMTFPGTADAPSGADTYLLLSDRGFDASALTGDRVTYLGLCDVA